MEEQSFKVTEGGVNYLVDGELKIRQDITNRRLEEDGETFEEYKRRQKHIRHFMKLVKKGKLMWDSRRGTYVEREFVEYLKYAMSNGAGK